MSVATRLLSSILVFGLLALAAWILRPDQSRAVSTRWFRGRERDSLFRLLFDAAGRPRRYAWCVPIVWALVWIAVLWVLPFH